MFALIISIVVFGSVSLLVVALSRPRLSAIEARIASLRTQVASGQVSELALPFEERVLAPMVRGFGRRLSNFLPATFLAGVQKSLGTAGLEMTAVTFVTIWAMCVGAFSSVGLLAVVVMGGLVTSTLLTLVVLPVVYYWLETRRSPVRTTG